VTFNQPMKTSGGGNVLDKGQFDNNIDNLTLGGDVSILSVTYNAATQTATLTIDTNDLHWQAGSQFRLRVKGGIRNACDVKQDSDVNILFTTQTMISGQVRNNLDSKGIYGVTVALTGVSCGGTCATTTTDLNGNFGFVGYAPGIYTLVETDLPGYSSVSDSSGANDNQVLMTLLAGVNSSGHFFIDTPATCVSLAVASTNPANGATNFPLSTSALTVTFNQPMITYGGGSVLDIGNFDNHIDNLSLGGDVPILDVSYNPNTSTTTLTVDTSDPQWQAGSQFRLRIKGGLKNSCGTNLGNDVDILFTTQAFISGQVCNSLDNQGIYRATVTLTGASCGGTCATTTTDLSGNFRFSGFAPGDYTILETNLPGYSGLLDSTPPPDDQIPFTLTAGSNSSGHLFTDTPSCAGGANFVASSVPTNGIIGVSLNTTTLTVTFNQPMITYGGGSVLNLGNFDNNIDNLSLGGDVPILSTTYDPTTYTATLTINTADPQWRPGSQFRLRIRDSIKNACDGRPTANFDVLFTTDLIISGQVRSDIDGDGDLLDPDTGLNNVTIQLWNSAETILLFTTTTNSGGFFTFNRLSPGTYVIREIEPANHHPTADTDPPNDNRITVILSAGTNSFGHKFLDAPD
jgi:hypothetical protein